MIIKLLRASALLALAAQATGAGTQATRPAEESVASAKLRSQPGLTPNANLLFNGWGLTPAGEHVPVSDLALRLAMAPDRKALVAVSGGFNDTGLTLLEPDGSRVRQFLPLRSSWNGLAFSKDGKTIYVGGAGSGRIHVFNYNAGTAAALTSVKPLKDESDCFIAGLAVHPVTGKLYVCNEANHELLVLQPDTLALETRLPVGQHPHSCIFAGDKRHLYVSNWGNRSVSVVDTRTNRRLRDINVGLRPNELALAPDGRLFVACAGDNTVHVIQTQTVEKPDSGPSPTQRPPENSREIIVTSLYPDSPEGSTPDAVAVSPDGKTLFVANADNNAVMVADLSDANVTSVKGFIPTGWYPTALLASPDGRTLLVANGKGLRSRPNSPPQLENPRLPRKSSAFDYIGRTLEGSISRIALPDGPKLAAYTGQVRQNSPYTPEMFQHAPIQSESIIPEQVGAACPIKYVLYIIKENRTYDQVFGDLRDAQGKAIGNGNSNLTMYGEAITPNHHQLARDYVLLDNLYCNGEVSADGHSWCDAAIATDYNQRAWLSSYSKHGQIPGNEEMENPAAGYLWDLCRHHGLSFKTYGEAVRHVPTTSRGRWRGSRDMDKAKDWIADLQAAEKSGSLPRLTIMSLGEDHTRGTTPGSFTPDASVGSNDLGLGRIVEAASRSRFWNEMAIFVIEDDAQNGPDHVDAHRTVGLVLSPWCKRQVTDSTLYTTAGMVRTIELILGLPPMTQYDAGATPMFSCFQKTAESMAYSALTPKIDLQAKNTNKSPFAKESKRMDFDEYDRAPEDALNRILWAVAKGPDESYPAPIHRLLLVPTAATR
jgi:YVTN family beta-propeller protein